MRSWIPGDSALSPRRRLDRTNRRPWVNCQLGGRLYEIRFENGVIWRDIVFRDGIAVTDAGKR